MIRESRRYRYGGAKLAELYRRHKKQFMLVPINIVQQAYGFRRVSISPRRMGKMQMALEEFGLIISEVTETMFMVAAEHVVLKQPHVDTRVFDNICYELHEGKTNIQALIERNGIEGEYIPED